MGSVQLQKGIIKGSCGKVTTLHYILIIDARIIKTKFHGI